MITGTAQLPEGAPHWELPGGRTPGALRPQSVVITQFTSLLCQDLLPVLLTLIYTIAPVVALILPPDGLVLTIALLPAHPLLLERYFFRQALPIISWWIGDDPLHQPLMQL